MRDKKKITLQLDVYDDGVLRYGQRVYVVIRTRYKDFREKCPICDDTTKVTIRSVEFDCPNCRGYSNSRSATSISLYNYETEEYIINKVKIEGEEVRGAYKKDGSPADGRYPNLSYGGFAKRGNGYNSISTKRFCSYNFEPHDPDKISLQRDVGGEFCFLNANDAKAFAKRLHERQKEMLEKFNAEHGTNHQYPFTY